jgi:hypothetical protein
VSNNISLNLSVGSTISVDIENADATDPLTVTSPTASANLTLGGTVQSGLPSLEVEAGDGINVTTDSGAFVISATAQNLTDLGGIDTTGAANGHILEYNGTSFVSVSNPAATKLGELDDVSNTAPTANQTLVYNSTASEWQPGDVALTFEELTNGTATVDSDLVLDPDTGAVEIQGGTDGSASLTLNCEQNSHGITIKAPAHSSFSGNVSLTLPADDGIAGQVLSTDGAGVLSWSAGNVNWVTAPTKSDDSGSAGEIAYDTAGFFYVHDGTMWRRTQLSSFGIAAPVITVTSNTPQDVDATQGDNVTFSVSASVTQGVTLSYQWQVSVDGGNNFANITNQTGSNYTFSVVNSDTGNQYRCIVSAPGAAVVNSRVAGLTVSATARLLGEDEDTILTESGDVLNHDGAGAGNTTGTGGGGGGDGGTSTNPNLSASFTLQPQDINGYAFESWPKTISFSVAGSASGGDIGYQWSSGPRNGDWSEWADISGATSSTLVRSISENSSKEGLGYRCRLSVAGVPGPYSNVAVFRRVEDFEVLAPSVSAGERNAGGNNGLIKVTNPVTPSGFSNVNWYIEFEEGTSATGGGFTWGNTSSAYSSLANLSTYQWWTGEADSTPSYAVPIWTDGKTNEEKAYRVRAYATVNGQRTEWSPWAYYAWGAIQNPQNVGFFGGSVAFEASFASQQYYYSFASPTQDVVTALQWQRSTDTGTTWTNVGGATSATLSTTSASVGDQFRLMGGTPGRATVYTKAAQVIGYSQTGGSTPTITINTQPTNYTASQSYRSFGWGTYGGGSNWPSPYAEFSVSASLSDLATPTYQWQYSSDGTNFYDFTADSTYLNNGTYDEATLQIWSPALQSSSELLYLRCVVGDTANRSVAASVTSDSATLDFRAWEVYTLAQYGSEPAGAVYMRHIKPTYISGDKYLLGELPVAMLFGGRGEGPSYSGSYFNGFTQFKLRFFKSGTSTTLAETGIISTTADMKLWYTAAGGYTMTEPAYPEDFPAGDYYTQVKEFKYKLEDGTTSETQSMGSSGTGFTYGASASRYRTIS